MTEIGNVRHKMFDAELKPLDSQRVEFTPDQSVKGPRAEDGHVAVD